MILTEISLLLHLIQINVDLETLEENERALAFGEAPTPNLQAKQVE